MLRKDYMQINFPKKGRAFAIQTYLPVNLSIKDKEYAFR